MTMEQLWDWDKVDGRNVDADPIIRADWCNEFGKELWFDLIKSMCMKHN